MRVKLLLFAALRERLGVAHELLELPEAVLTVGALRLWLCARGPDWAEALGETRTVACALNQHVVGLEAPLGDGAEVAFFPPVTGG